MDPMLEKVLLMMAAATVAYAFSRVGRNRDRKTDKVLSDELVAISEVKTRDNRITELERAVEHLESMLSEQQKAAIPITAAMQAMLIAKLTNDHTPEADALLKKQTDGTLTVDDAIRFAKLMKERKTDPRIGRAQQIAAEMLPLTIELKKLDEAAAAKGPCEVKTLMVTVPATETKRARDGGTQEEEKGN